MIKKSDSPLGLEMYFNETVAEKFAVLQQNEKNFRVSAIIDRVIDWEMRQTKDPLQVAELGAGAHADRYHRLFERLLKSPRGRIDWVDISPYMLKLAAYYLKAAAYAERLAVINFEEKDIFEYLNDLPDGFLDLVIMKYTIEDLANIDELFSRLAVKLKPGGRLVSTIGFWSPELKNEHTNARIFYQGQEMTGGEPHLLTDGDSFRLKFYKESGQPESGYLEGAEVTKYYHAPERFRLLAQLNGLEIFFGDWQSLLPPERWEGENLSQMVMVLRKLL